MLHIFSSDDTTLIGQLIASAAANDDIVVIAGTANNTTMEDLATSPATLYYLPASQHGEDNTQKTVPPKPPLKHAATITDDAFLALCEKHTSIHTWY